MTTPKTYQKKPARIQAMQWDGTKHGADHILAWMIGVGYHGAVWRDDKKHTVGPGRGITTITDRIEIATPEGPLRAHPGDWIIRSIAGEFYPCKPNVFEATYEEAGNQVSDIPEAALEAAVAAFDDLLDGERPVNRADLMHAILKAALPHIREMIAEEIRAERNQASRPELADRYGGYYRGLISGLDLAAKIVRGDVK